MPAMFSKIPAVFGRPCMFHMLTKIYCPGCGGTRAVYYLLTGHPGLSFLYHPFVIYTLFAVCWITWRYAISLIRGLVCKTPVSYRPSAGWLWAALWIVLGNWALKNFCLIVLHVDLLSIL